jgi:hypothetical protein
VDVGRKALHLSSGAHVDSPRQHITADPAEFALGIREPRLVEIANHQPSIAAGTSQCELTADAAAGARHQRGGSRKIADVHPLHPASALGTVADPMDFVEAQGFLSHDVVVDTTLSSGGSGAPLLIERFADAPFQATLGNVRCSDILDDFAATRSGAVLDWLVTDVIPACNAGAAYSENVPFKLQFEGKDEDGILDPHETRFTGNAVLLTGPEAGSQLDQFTAMWIDNGLGLSMGMPSGGYSNTWEWFEPATFPDDGSYVVWFAYSIGHTIRPNGEVLEGNPARPLIHYPLTEANFRTYFGDLFAAALSSLEQLRNPAPVPTSTPLARVLMAALVAALGARAWRAQRPGE